MKCMVILSPYPPGVYARPVPGGVPSNVFHWSKGHDRPGSPPEVANLPGYHNATRPETVSALLEEPGAYACWMGPTQHFFARGPDNAPSGPTHRAALDSFRELAAQGDKGGHG